MIKKILNNKYKIIKEIGSGGMSTVYQCTNVEDGKIYAVKGVKSDVNNLSLENEWYLLNHLNHNGIPKVIELFIEQNNLYLVEEFVNGVTLHQMIERNSPIGLSTLCKISLELCNILNYLHSFNPPIIYRDLKPSNIIITEENQVKLIDFGISRLFKEGKHADTVFMGSRGFAAPEQFGLSQSQIQTDVYGLGAVMYFMIFGHGPNNLLEPLSDEHYDASIPQKLIGIIQKSMQIDIQKRYSNIDELKNEILLFLNEHLHPIDKNTRILNDNSAPTVILSTHVRTAAKNSSKKFSKFNRLVHIVSFLVIIFLCLGIVNWFFIIKEKKILPQNEKINDSKVQVPDKSSTEKANTEVEQKPVKKEVVIEGAFYLDSPSEIITLKYGVEDDDYGKKKGKNKEKQNKNYNDLESRNSKVYVYSLEPQATVTKADKFIMKAERLDFSNDYTVIHCYIKNNTNMDIPVDLNSIYVSDSAGNKIYPISSTVNKINIIQKNTELESIKLYFKSFKVSRGKLYMNSYFDFNDENYENTVKLPINIK
jgi:serine/threonine protein kinase